MSISKRCLDEQTYIMVNDNVCFVSVLNLLGVANTTIIAFGPLPGHISDLRLCETRGPCPCEQDLLPQIYV